MIDRILSTWGWITRRGLGAGWFVVGLLLGSLPERSDPLTYGFLRAPLHLRLALWIGVSIFLAALLRICYLRIRRPPPEASIYVEDEERRLSRWATNPHWRAFDRNIEFLSAPNLLEPRHQGALSGWIPSDLRLYLTSGLELSTELRQVHREWCSQLDPKQLEKDGIKFALCRNPFSETDQHFVDLTLAPTRWSEVQAFLGWIDHKSQGSARLFRTVDPGWSRPHKPRMVLESSKAPQSLCLHGVVVTADNQLLAIQRPGPEHTDYYPNAWSISFEEQLSVDDLVSGQEQLSAEAWMRRAVRQEVLGEAVDRCFNLKASRFVAVALEEPIFNAFVVAVVPVTCDAQELGHLLPHAPDRREWQQFTFLPLEAPFSEVDKVFMQSRMPAGGELHPTSRFRLYLALTALRPMGAELLRRGWMERRI